MVAFEDLLAPVTADQVKRSIYNVLEATGANTTVWKPGAVVRTIITALSIVIAGFAQLIYLALAGGFLTLATGNWLTLLARFVYKVEREVATFASGDVRLTNTGGGLFTFGPGAFRVKNLDTLKTYKNIAGFTLNPNASLTIAFVADEKGSASSSVAGGITGFAGAVLPLVTVVNPASLVGLDEESDSSLTVRCFDKLGALSPNGPTDAYAWVARNAKRPDGTPIGVNRLSFSRDGYGNIFLVVANPSGAVTGVYTDPNTDLGALYLSVLKQCTPLCITPHAQSAVQITQNFAGTIYAYSTQGLTEASLVAAAAKALGEMLARAPIGGYTIDNDNRIPQQTAADAIAQAVSSVYYVKFNVPANDITPGLQQVVGLGTVSFNVVFQQKASL